MVEELVTDLGTWKELITKNVWRKWYRKSSPGDERVEVVDMFCASFATVNHLFVGGADRGEACFNFMRAGNGIAEGLASQSEDHYDGWKLHRDWFKCMIAQLAIEAARERDGVIWNNSRAEEHKTLATLHDLFALMKWDLGAALKPSAGELTKVVKVWYNYVDKKSGIDEKRHYMIILEPTHPIPLHSVYRAASGKHWAVVGLNGNGTIKLAHEAVGDEKELAMVLSLTPSQIYGMERVV